MCFSVLIFFYVGLLAMWTWWSSHRRHQRMYQNWGVKITAKTMLLLVICLTDTSSHHSIHLRAVLLPVRGLPSHQVCQDYPCSMLKVIFISVSKWLQNKSWKICSSWSTHDSHTLCLLHTCIERMYNELTFIIVKCSRLPAVLFLIGVILFWNWFNFCYHGQMWKLGKTSYFVCVKWYWHCHFLYGIIWFTVIILWQVMNTSFVHMIFRCTCTIYWCQWLHWITKNKYFSQIFEHAFVFLEENKFCGGLGNCRLFELLEI